MEARRHIPFLLGALLLIPGCKKDEAVEPLDLGYGYFPINVGHWVEYEVDTTWYDQAFDVSGSNSYMLREVVVEEFTDPGGRLAQRIHRFVKDSLGNWQIRDVWWQTRDAYAAEKTEEDVRQLKLSFPVNADKRWNINAYNTETDIDVRYRQLNTAWSVNGLAFDSTVMVQGTYPSNLIDTLIYEERYAKHAGLVFKHQVRSNTQYIPQPPLAPIPRTRGWTLTMRATAFGD